MEINKQKYNLTHAVIRSSMSRALQNRNFELESYEEIIERLWLWWLVLLDKKMDRYIRTFDREIRVLRRELSPHASQEKLKNKREKTGKGKMTKILTLYVHVWLISTVCSNKKILCVQSVLLNLTNNKTFLGNLCRNIFTLGNFTPDLCTTFGARTVANVWRNS